MIKLRRVVKVFGLALFIAGIYRARQSGLTIKDVREQLRKYTIVLLQGLKHVLISVWDKISIADSSIM